MKRYLTRFFVDGIEHGGPDIIARSEKDASLIAKLGYPKVPSLEVIGCLKEKLLWKKH